MIAKCGFCEQDFSPTPKQRKNIRKGRDVYCSKPCIAKGVGAKHKGVPKTDKYNDIPAGVLGERGPVRGPCKHCGAMFRSYGAKIYCSMSCYQASPECKQRLKDNSYALQKASREAANLRRNERPQKPCLECGEVMYPQPKQMKTKRFCSQPCYRAYMSKRFDRWVANPQSIALPQCYDEFLSNKELPCLIAGCDWVGKHLGSHVNFTHGITAEQFKEMVGFNKTTGLVTPDLSKHLSQRYQTLLAKRPDIVALFIERCAPKSTRRAYRVSLEAKEHSKKSRALLKHATIETDATCRLCGKKLTRGYFGRKLYCDIACQRTYYANRRWELTCCWCGDKFLGKYNQKKRSREELDVCCSNQCRNARNLTLSPNHIKHRERRDKHERVS